MRTWLAVVAVVLSVGGCSDSQTSNAERVSFIAESDRICRSTGLATQPALKAIFPVPNGLPDVSAARRLGPAYVTTYRDALRQRQTLTAPSSDAGRLEQHYTAYREALDDFAALVQSLGDQSAADFAQRLDPISKEFYALNRFEKDYGFKQCGSEPDQTGDRNATGSS